MDAHSRYGFFNTETEVATPEKSSDRQAGLQDGLGFVKRSQFSIAQKRADKVNAKDEELGADSASIENVKKMVRSELQIHGINAVLEF
mmetsp:Transcript_30196/g.34569  ORF Transcript_30196/g.34569 Transcript_30196/m.34569 type:complete len:88 (+) Transcript_30196:1-264(+)